jgi:hypothetical protein
MNKILADTSVWIEFFKSDSPTGNELERLLKEGVVYTCGIVVFELLQRIKSSEEKSTLLDILLTLEYIEMSLLLWQKAADLSIKLKKKGLTLPLSDIFISTLAIEHNLSIFTLDEHFEKIPGIKLYKSH